MWSVLLTILKFVALGIGTASGLVGTLAKTKDESTGKLSRGGKLIVSLIVASGVVAGSTQAIESYLKRIADQADQAQRLQEFEALYSLTHPLGDLRVQVNITYPITTGIGGLDGSWLSRVRQSTSATSIVMNDESDVLRPKPNDQESREFKLLIDPMIDFTLNRTPTQSGNDGKYLLDHGAALGYRATTTRSFLYVDLDERKIDNQIYATTSKLEDDGSISSWRDLYGAEIIVQLPQTAPAGARITRCILTFSNGAQFGSRVIEVPLTEADRRMNPFNDAFSNISYVHVLSEAELGAKPNLLH